MYSERKDPSRPTCSQPPQKILQCTLDNRTHSIHGDGGLPFLNLYLLSGTTHCHQLCKSGTACFSTHRMPASSWRLATTGLCITVIGYWMHPYFHMLINSIMLSLFLGFSHSGNKLCPASPLAKVYLKRLKKEIFYYSINFVKSNRGMLKTKQNTTLLHNSFYWIAHLRFL